MTKKTLALALRTIPYSKTSCIVTWLTPQHGRVATVMKGAARPRSPFLGQYDVGYLCELIFYTRARNGIHIAKECAPVQTTVSARKDWRALAGLSYVCDLLSRTSEPGGHIRQLYDLGLSTVEFISSHEPKCPLIFWFELHLMSALGMAPQLGQCARCGMSDIATRASLQAWFFSAAHGGLLCPACNQAPGGEPVDFSRMGPSTPVSPDVLAILRKWQIADTPRMPCNTRCTPKQFLAFDNILGMFLAYHLDLVPAGRRIVIDMLTKNVHVLIGMPSRSSVQMPGRPHGE